MLGPAPHHLALHLDDPLAADRRERLGRLGAILGAQDHLDDAATVPQVEEHQPAVVAAALHPGLELHPAPHVLGCYRSRSPTLHTVSFSVPPARPVPEPRLSR